MVQTSMRLKYEPRPVPSVEGAGNKLPTFDVVSFFS